VHFDPQPIGPFAKSMAITKRGDVRVVATPGHTPDHVSVYVEGEPAFLLAGDTSYSQEILLARRVDGVSPKPAVALDTLDRIAALAQERPLVYLPSHDCDAANRLRDLVPLNPGTHRLISANEAEVPLTLGH
jgi:N-acyl homoserine lactone hydrolase